MYRLLGLDTKDPRAGLLGAIIIGVALSATGVQGIWTALRNRTPTTMPIEQYISNRPKASWLELQGAKLDFENAWWESNYGIISTIFVPARAQNEEKGRDTAVAVVVEIDDRETIKLIARLKAVAEDEALTALIRTNANKLSTNRNILGVVQSGLWENDGIRHSLRRTNSQLAADFVIITEGDEPSAFWSVVMLCGGVLVTIVMIREWATQSAAGLLPALMTPPPLPIRRDAVRPPLPPRRK